MRGRKGQKMITISRCTEATECQHHLRVIYDEKQNEAKSQISEVFKKIACEPGVIAERKNHRQEDNALGSTMIDHRRAKSEASTRHKDKDKARSEFRRGCPGREVRSREG